MMKYLELLFLRQLRGIGLAKINSTYFTALLKSNNIDELIDNGNIDRVFSNAEIATARSVASDIYSKHTNASDLIIITMFDAEYPKSLNDLKDNKPVILYCKGNTDLLSRGSAAVIGTRHISDDGIEATKRITKAIVTDFDRVIVSGLALGCDQIAHKTAIDLDGYTIAVLPCGLDTVVPTSNKGLAKSIIENKGCLLSEYEYGTSVNKFNYTSRDRITAALSNEVMVVECSEDSGTMKTVKAAYDLDRRIGCYVPAGNCGGDYSGNKKIMSSMGGEEFSDIDGLRKFYKTEMKQEQMSLFD